MFVCTGGACLIASNRAYRDGGDVLANAKSVHVRDYRVRRVLSLEAPFNIANAAPLKIH